MKLAHLILAHANAGQLLRLIDKLSHPDTHIYVHLDKKTDISAFVRLKEIPNVFFVQKRKRVHWGAYSIVEATLSGFEDILASSIKYDFVNLLSGADYPIKSVTEISNFFNANTGKAFMEYYPVLDVWKEAIPRITEYHLTNYHFFGKYLVQRLMNVLLPKRKLPLSMVAVGRSQWFTITGEHVEYIVKFLRKNPIVSRFFKLTWGADELIFQTILYNSPYQKDMINNNLRFIDWSAGGVSPKTFVAEDVQSLITSDKLYARKFGTLSNDPALDVLDQHISNTVINA